MGTKPGETHSLRTAWISVISSSWITDCAQRLYSASAGSTSSRVAPRTVKPSGRDKINCSSVCVFISSIPVLQAHGQHATPFHRSEIRWQYSFQPFDRGVWHLSDWKHPHPGQSFLCRVDKNYQMNAAIAPLPNHVCAMQGARPEFRPSRFPCEDGSARNLQSGCLPMRSTRETGQNPGDQTYARTSAQTPLRGFPSYPEMHRSAPLKLHAHAHLYRMDAVRSPAAEQERWAVLQD